VPDLDHFRGSFGGRAVIPLWHDAAATRPNLDATWLARLRAWYGPALTPAAVMAYSYAVLVPRAYVARYGHALNGQGPRLPWPRSRELFWTTAAAGFDLLAWHTFRVVPVGTAAVRTPIPTTPYPRGFAYVPAARALRIGVGEIGPINADVWDYRVSGLAVVPGWLRRRLRPRRGTSPLDAVQPAAWSTDLTAELLALLATLEHTLAREPALAAQLERIVADAHPAADVGRTRAGITTAPRN
jgi:hypothetical protein